MAEKKAKKKAKKKSAAKAAPNGAKALFEELGAPMYRAICTRDGYKGPAFADPEDAWGDGGRHRAASPNKPHIIRVVGEQSG